MPDYTVKADVDSMLRADNDAGIRSAIGLGQTDAPTFLAQSLTGQSLTGVQATSLINLAATWDTTGTPSLIYARVTTTNANNNAKLLDLGTFSQGEVFSVSRYGGVYSGDSVSVATGSHMSGTTVGVGPTGRIGFSSNLGSASTFVFSTGLYQDAAGILAQRNGTAKQALRVYNTFLGTTANEWGGFDWLTTTNTLRIGTEHGGTGAARPIDFVTGGVVRLTLATSGSLISTVNFSVGNAQMAASYYYLGGAYLQESGGVFQITNGTIGAYRDLRLRNVIQSPGVGTTVTPVNNGELVFETTSNTSVTLKLKGSDGTVRSVALTLS
jgi:hypothetical protein